MKFTIKLFVTSAAIIAYIAVSLPFHLFLRGDKRLKAGVTINTFFGWLLLRILNIRPILFNKEKLSLEKNVMIVANHVSYTDVLIVASCMPTLFITSVEVKLSGLPGLISSLGGSLFVERRNRAGLKYELQAVADKLTRGFNVTLFAEATSSDGSGVLPFRSAMVESVIMAEKKILPLCIKYTSINGASADRSNLDAVCYYGDMTFFPHLIRLLKQKSVQAEVTVLQPIDTTGMTRKEASAAAFEVIDRRFHSHADQTLMPESI